MVYGRLLSVDDTAITVACWTYADAEIHQAPEDQDIKTFTILRATVKSIMAIG